MNRQQINRTTENRVNKTSIEPKIWKEEYENKEFNLIIEDNTIYEIDIHCINCKNS